MSEKCLRSGHLRGETSAKRTGRLQHTGGGVSICNSALKRYQERQIGGRALILTKELPRGAHDGLDLVGGAVGQKVRQRLQENLLGDERLNGHAA